MRRSRELLADCQHVREALGTLVHRERRRLKLSQTELAAALGESQSMISRIELGTALPNFVVWHNLCRVFGYAPDYNTAFKKFQKLDAGLQAVDQLTEDSR